MKIIFDPCKSSSNEYVNIITRELSNLNVSSYPLNSTLKDMRLLSQIDAVHLNWFENISSKSTLKRFYSFAKKIITLFILISFRKKIYWTLHNKQPHDQKNQAYSKVLMYFLAKISKTVFIHSKESEHLLEKYYGSEIRNKSKYIPHPHYIDAYPEGVKAVANQSDILKLLFVGAVKPYKNIELLIEAFKKINSQDVQLTIAGKPSSSTYANALLKDKVPNLNLHLSFVPDLEMIRLIKENDALILPYNIESSLNSGTVFLAFSNRKTVICPEIATIKDFENSKNILSYNYSSNTEHISKLTSIIQYSIQLKKENPSIFNEMGENMYQKIRLNNDPKLIASELLKIYKS